jgi:hypothetical protein
MQPLSKFLDLVDSNRVDIKSYSDALYYLTNEYEYDKTITLLGASLPKNINHLPIWFTIELALEFLSTVDKLKRMRAVSVLTENQSKIDDLHRLLGLVDESYSKTTSNWLKPSIILSKLCNLKEYNNPNELIIVFDNDEIFDKYKNELKVYLGRQCGLIKWSKNGIIEYSSFINNYIPKDITRVFSEYSSVEFIEWIGKIIDINVTSYYAGINSVRSVDDAFFYVAFDNNANLDDILGPYDFIFNYFSRYHIISRLSPFKYDHIEAFLSKMGNLMPDHGDAEDDDKALSYLSEYLKIDGGEFTELLAKNNLKKKTLESLKGMNSFSDDSLNLLGVWFISLGVFRNTFSGNTDWNKLFIFSKIKNINLSIPIFPKLQKKTRKKGIISLYELFNQIFVNDKDNKKNTLTKILAENNCLKYFCDISCLNTDTGLPLYKKITNIFHDFDEMNIDERHGTSAAICKYWLISLAADPKNGDDLIGKDGIFPLVSRLNVIPNSQNTTIFSFSNKIHI